MDYEPSAEDIEELIRDYKEDFGVTLPVEDAERILTLYNELCFHFGKHAKEVSMQPYFFLEQ
jgi:hypothetical protein